MIKVFYIVILTLLNNYFSFSGFNGIDKGELSPHIYEFLKSHGGEINHKFYIRYPFEGSWYYGNIRCYEDLIQMYLERCDSEFLTQKVECFKKRLQNAWEIMLVKGIDLDNTYKPSYHLLLQRSFAKPVERFFYYRYLKIDLINSTRGIQEINQEVYKVRFLNSKSEKSHSHFKKLDKMEWK